MHFSSFASRAIVALPLFALACTSEIVDLFPSIHEADAGSDTLVPGSTGGGGAAPTGTGGASSGDGGSAAIDAASGASGNAGATDFGDAGPSGSGGAAPIEAGPPEAGPLVCNPSTCSANAHCLDDAPTCACNPAYLGDGTTCHSVAEALNGQRVDLPCLEESNNDALCRTVREDPRTPRTLDGDKKTTYLVTIRIRGIVEMKTYFGGDGDGAFRAGGDPRNDAWNIYRLEVSEPPQTYYLNAGPENMYTTAIDEQHVVRIRGGAEVRLRCDPQDHTNGAGVQIKNRDADGNPLASPEGVEPSDHPYDGQFLQIDGVSAVVEP
jgi:hypothetical protein